LGPSFVDQTAKRVSSSKLLKLGLKLFIGLFVVRILGDTIYRADFDTLWLVEVTHTLGAKIRGNHVDLITLADCIIRALRDTYITVDALIGNH
jgi:hypothetical protein